MPNTAPAGSVHDASARAREAEVGDAHATVLVEEQVGRLHVAVHDSPRVRVVERIGDVAADARGLRGAQEVAAVEHRAQAAAFEQLDDHERLLVLAPVVDRHDVRVVQRGRDLGLGAEPAQEAGVLREGRAAP